MFDVIYRRAAARALCCLLLFTTATSVPAAPEGRDPDLVAHLRTAETAKSAGDAR